MPEFEIPVYAIDIETDTAAGGLDPARARITTMAIAHGYGEWAHSGDEKTMLDMAAIIVAGLTPGIFVGWNSAVFDLPFLVTRAQICGSHDFLSVLEIVHDIAIVAKYHAATGVEGGYRGQFRRHRHVDISPYWRAYATEHQIEWSLKSVAGHFGLEPIVEDMTMLHHRDHARVEAYCASDVRVTRALALAMGPQLLDAAEAETQRFQACHVGGGRE